jgi:hypothetical protein
MPILSHVMETINIFLYLRRLRLFANYTNRENMPANSFFESRRMRRGQVSEFIIFHLKIRLSLTKPFSLSFLHLLNLLWSDSTASVFPLILLLINFINLLAHPDYH